MLPEHDDPNYNCIVTTDTGVQRKLYANWLHNNGQDHWQGWHCASGHQRFYIDSDFEIWGGECQNDHLGKVLEDFAVQTNSVCKQTTCTGCTDDLMTFKQGGAL